MDFNHPFAGKTVEFAGEVVEVRDATEEELHPHHGCGGCGCGKHQDDSCGCGDDCGCGGHSDSNCGCGDSCGCSHDGDNCGCK